MEWRGAERKGMLRKKSSSSGRGRTNQLSFSKPLVTDEIPYQDSSPEDYERITQTLIQQHLLDTEEIKEVCLTSKEDILSTRIDHHTKGL